MRIGVLSLQGGVIEHLNCLKTLDVNTVEVKYPKDLEGLDGIIFPGGESTTIGKLLRGENLFDPLKKKLENGLPAFGTCAGMILLSKNIENDELKHFGLMDISVKRNAYGTQLNSFSGDDIITEVSKEPIPLVFIRAPYIVKVGTNVRVLHTLHGNIVAARENNLLVTSFHPELTENLEFHKYFLKMCATAKTTMA